MSMHSLELDRGRSSTPVIDKYTIAPIAACVFALIVSPLILFVVGLTGPGIALQSLMEPRPENRIFWPAMATLSVVLAVRNRSHLSRLTFPPHIVCLIAYLAFAGASVL